MGWGVPCFGSSPHTRGAPAPGFSIRPGAGIIPAYAGSTVMRSCCLGSFSDHPRIRGEHRRPVFREIRIRGSSPHTRGALGRHCRERAPCRIIPAYAGSTGDIRFATLAGKDHPRIRGEHPITRPGGDGRSRIIPAYAGSTGTDPVKPLQGLGSSPHTRGAQAVPLCDDGLHRIIPAYAGSTSC